MVKISRGRFPRSTAGFSFELCHRFFLCHSTYGSCAQFSRFLNFGSRPTWYVTMKTTKCLFLCSPVGWWQNQRQLSELRAGMHRYESDDLCFLFRFFLSERKELTGCWIEASSGCCGSTNFYTKFDSKGCLILSATKIYLWELF